MFDIKRVRGDVTYGRHRCEVCQRIFEDRPCIHHGGSIPRLCSEKCALQHKWSGERDKLKVLYIAERLSAVEVTFPKKKIFTSTIPLTEMFG